MKLDPDIVGALVEGEYPFEGGTYFQGRVLSLNAYGDAEVAVPIGWTHRGRDESEGIIIGVHNLKLLRPRTQGKVGYSPEREAWRWETSSGKAFPWKPPQQTNPSSRYGERQLRQPNTQAFDDKYAGYLWAVSRFNESHGELDARLLFRAAFVLAPIVMHDKEIPAADLKAFQKIVKETNRSRFPKDIRRWLADNRGGLELLLKTNSWPEKGSSGDQRVGSFVVHNQTGKDITANLKLLETAETLMRDSGIPKIDAAVYGDVYFVGDIDRRRTVMALYYPKRDVIHIIIVKRFTDEVLHSILHEFGHRYYDKICKSSTAKGQWLAHHRRVGAIRVDLPEIGSKIATDKKDATVTGIQYDRRGRPNILLEGGGYIPADAFLRIAAQYNFPTFYAAKDAEEHFCESFALFCMGELADPHREPFESIVGVTKKAAPTPAPPTSKGPRGQLAMFNPRRNAQQSLVAAPKYRYLGTDDEESTCACCGREGLKRVVWLVELDDEGNEVGREMAYGTTCGAHLLARRCGKKPSRPEAEKIIEAARKESMREAICATAHLQPPAATFFTNKYDVDMVAVGDAKSAAFDRRVPANDVAALENQWHALRAIEWLRERGIDDVYAGQLLGMITMGTHCRITRLRARITNP